MTVASDPYLIEERIEGVRKQLLAGHVAGKGMSSSSKGNEREQFVASVLTAFFSPMYRFGTGDIVDKARRRTGQLDLVVEYPFIPSFPAMGGGPRLYAAEGVAAVVEVKSDLMKQREDIVKTATRVKEVVPAYQRADASGRLHGVPGIPMVAIGYTGWKTEASMMDLIATGKIDVVYQVEPSIFVCSTTIPWYTKGRAIEGPAALVALVDFLARALAQYDAVASDLVVYTDPTSSRWEDVDLRKKG